MGEYLTLILNDGLKIKDKEIRKLLETSFKDQPRLINELWVKDGEITAKLGVCEEVFFTFEEIIAIYKFIKKYKVLFRYGERQRYNMTPEKYLKDRTSLYMGGFERYAEKNGLKQVLITKYVKQIAHRKVWKKYFKTVSKNGKSYYKKVPKSKTTGVYGNPNGKQVKCQNEGKQFKAYPSGFAWNYKNNKGRNLYNCPRCKVTFNQGEYKTPQYKWLSKELKQEV